MLWLEPWGPFTRAHLDELVPYHCPRCETLHIARSANLASLGARDLDPGRRRVLVESCQGRLDGAPCGGVLDWHAQWILREDVLAGRLPDAGLYSVTLQRPHARVRAAHASPGGDRIVGWTGAINGTALRGAR